MQSFKEKPGKPTEWRVRPIHLGDPQVAKKDSGTSCIHKIKEISNIIEST